MFSSLSFDGGVLRTHLTCFCLRPFKGPTGYPQEEKPTASRGPVPELCPQVKQV